MRNLQTSSPAVTDSKKPISAAIRQGVEWATSVGTNPNPSTPHSRIRQRRPADVFASDKGPGAIFSAQSELNHDVQKFDPPLISIGPNTDSALDRFNLGDELLPKLRVLVSTVRSSRWESVFRSQQWDLTYDQALVLSRALLTDLQGKPLNHEIVKVSDIFVGGCISAC